MTKPIIKFLKRASAVLFTVTLTIGISACSMSTLPWPDLSISRDEANDGLSKVEQSELEKILTVNQKTHREDAKRDIEKR